MGEGGPSLVGFRVERGQTGRTSPDSPVPGRLVEVGLAGLEIGPDQNHADAIGREGGLEAAGSLVDGIWLLSGPFFLEEVLPGILPEDISLLTVLNFHSGSLVVSEVRPDLLP